jgi:hypothetical protein
MSGYDEYDVIMLEPFSGCNIGDILTVNRGLYNTLLDTGKGLPLNCWEDDVDDHMRLVINAKHLEKENDELWETNHELSQKNIDLSEQVTELEDKIKSYEIKKTKKKTTRKKTAKELS